MNKDNLKAQAIDLNADASSANPSSIFAAGSDKIIGAILGHLRRAEGYSQSSLGYVLGISPVKVREYEDGLVGLDLAMLDKYAVALNFDRRVFLESIGEYHQVSQRQSENRD